MAKKTKKAQYHLSSRFYAVVALCCVIIFSLAAATASKHTITAWENSIFDVINGWPDSLRSAFLMITQLGNAWMLLIVPFAAFANKQRALAKHLLINGAATLVLVELTKMLVDRPRPEFLRSGVTERELFVTGSGFPSGHTAMATVLALTILPYVPRKYWWLLGLWVLLVAVSRIYLGVHAPLDIIGGMAAGTAVVAVSHLWDSRKRTGSNKAAAKHSE